MFLDSLIRRNRRFVEVAIGLHQNGQIPANSCVLDLDTIRDNSELFAREAGRLGLKTFAMTKQLGRNPRALGAMVDGGIDSFVAVDMEGARTIHAAGFNVGHIGHLVQVPHYESREAAALDADYWTVFSDTKAREAAAAAHALGKMQALLARIQTQGDIFYMGHEGGFEASEIVAVAERLQALDGAHFAGITTFPALLFDQAERTVKPTPNMKTLEHAAEALEGAGVHGVEINAPGAKHTATGVDSTSIPYSSPTR
jgi:predicted amino acid racemase